MLEWRDYSNSQMYSESFTSDVLLYRRILLFRESLSFLRRKLGKLHILELVQKLTSPEMNCYVDIIPTGTSDNEVIKVFNSYVNIPALL
jgi:hypothetical protein